MKQRRGFILLLALAMLALVGIAILALAAACSSDGQRTMYRSQRAQLDELLLAGTAEAMAHLKNAVPTTGQWWETELPQTLTEQQAELVTTVDSVAANGDVTLNIHTTITNRSAEQTLRFSHGSDGWKLISAEVPL